MSEKSLKVLVIAEAANPEWTSVPLLGWSHAHELTKQFDAHLVTHVRNKPAIERFGWSDGKQFTAMDTEVIDRPIYKLGVWLRGGNNLAWTITSALGSITYPYFEYKIWRLFKSRLQAGEFDLVHRITPVSPTAPSYIAKKLKKLNIPYIVGPLNGGVPWPKEYRDLQIKEREWLSFVRGAYKLLPWYRAMRKHSSVLVAGSLATLQQLPDYTKDRSIYLPENAIDPERFPLREFEAEEQVSTPIKACFIGRLVPYKGADIAIEAMAPLLKSGSLKYDIFGEGPEFEPLQKLIDKLELNQHVTLKGFVKNIELRKALPGYDLFVFPSVREFGGGAVLEAMAMGIVPVIADYAGPAELVTESCGYKIKMGARAQLVANLQNTLRSITNNPHVLMEKKRACVSRIKKLYTWEQKAKQMSEIYDWALGKAGRPDWGLLENDPMKTQKESTE